MQAHTPNEHPEELLSEGELEELVAMTQAQKRFYTSPACLEARGALQQLVDSDEYNTDSDYFSTNERSFVERHLHYLSHNATINLEGYISNLRVMTRLDKHT